MHTGKHHVKIEVTGSQLKHYRKLGEVLGINLSLALSEQAWACQQLDFDF